MKRDKKLIEELLFEIETIDSAKNSKDIKIEGFTSKEIEEQLLYMYEQDLFNGKESHCKHKTENRIQYNWLSIRLKKEGHDLLEKAILEKELELLNEALKDTYGLALLDPPDKIISISGQKPFIGKIYLRAFKILEGEYLIEKKEGKRYEITGEGRKFLKQHNKFENNSTDNNKEYPPASLKKSGSTKNQIFETTINTYTVLELIGKGGSGKVYKVQDLDRKFYALKCLKEFNVSRETAKRFKSELFFCQQNVHKNIITAVDIGFIIKNNKKYPFYVMECYDKTLRDLMNEGITVNKVLPLFLMILDGIEDAHKKGIFHRDLKPENILFDSKSENLVIADFGIAHFTQEFLLTAIETKPNQKLANFQYAAPEQRERGQTVDSRADIFSLGLILNEMFTKKIPQGTNYKTIGSINPDFTDLDDLVKKMIDQDPLNRLENIEKIKLEINLRFNISQTKQRIHDLKKSLIAQPEFMDHIEKSLIKIISIDYSNDQMIYILNQDPNFDWIQIYSKLNYKNYALPYGPPEILFFKGEAKIDIGNSDSQTTTNFVKDVITRTNKIYKEKKIKEFEEEDRIKKLEKEREIEEEKKREQILKDIKLDED